MIKTPRKPFKPSHYLHPKVTIQPLIVSDCSRIREFGKDLKGQIIQSEPKASYSVTVSYPTEQEYVAKSGNTHPKAGTSQTDLFHEVDGDTFERAQTRSLASHGSRAMNVIKRTAEQYEQMGARLFLNDSGEGGLGVKPQTEDGRIESMGGFNTKFTSNNPNRPSVAAIRLGIMKLTGVNVSECMQDLAPRRLQTEGFKTVATLPIQARLPEGWPQDALNEKIHSQVKIPSRSASPSVIDNPAIDCETPEEFDRVIKESFKQIYEKYNLDR